MTTASGKTLRIQSVLYGNEPARIVETIRHLDRAVDHLIAKTDYDGVQLVYGDCSPKPVFSEEEVGRLRDDLYAIGKFDYRFFKANLGSALGHNTMLEDWENDDVLIFNPDIIMAPNALVDLAKSFDSDDVGMAEAKQLPIEHPKVYDTMTGETSWAATACALVRAETIASIGVFDHESFFLYCDDVDFSWRVRLSGRKVVYVPSAAVFHDKRLGKKGEWLVGDAERFYSAQAALFLSYKYSRQDLTSRWLSEFERTGESNFLRAAASFREREASGTLPRQIDPDHEVAMFVEGNYAPHRFKL